MLVCSILVLLGSVTAIVAEPDKNGAASPTRKATELKEVIEIHPKQHYRQRTEVTDGSASPRRNFKRQKLGSDAELEDAGRMAYQRSRGVPHSESQTHGSGIISPKRFLLESEVEELRRIAYQQKLRSASRPEIHYYGDGHRSGITSPSRSESELEVAQRKAQADTNDGTSASRSLLESELEEARKKSELEVARKKLQAQADGYVSGSDSESELEDVRRKTLLQKSEQHSNTVPHTQAHQANGYASDTDDPIKKVQSLSTSPSLERQNSKKRKRFLEFSTPKVFQSVCDHEKLKSNDPTLNDDCSKQCVELSNQIEDIYKNYPHMVKVETLHNECTGFTKGICRKAFDYRGKRTAACHCLEYIDKDNFRSQYAAGCRAGLSGLKIITNLDVATDGIRKSVRKWFSRTKKSRKSKKSKAPEEPEN